MALYTGRILVRKGNEADYDPDKLMPGEWALSTDKKIIRICVAAGICIRMATYDAFEEDVAKIEGILQTCQTIQEAVVQINEEVSTNADAVVEYTAQTKAYMESAKISAANAEISEKNSKTSEVNSKASEVNAKVSEETAQAVFESLPEDYNTLSDEFYEVAIKQNASGEDIHVTDSANAKVREFALFGKAKQESTTGKNLLENTATTKTVNGVTFTVNSDGSVTANGTATDRANFDIFTNKNALIPIGNYIVNGCPKGGSLSSYRFQIYNKTTSSGANDYGDGVELNISNLTDEITPQITIYGGYTANNLTFYPMLRLASIEDSTYEPYTGGIPSPNPDYPQEIEVAGSSGSVVVTSCGKNLTGEILEDVNVGETIIINGVEFKINNDKSVNVRGFSTGMAQIHYDFISDFTGIVVLTGSSSSKCHIYPWDVERNARPYTDETKTALQTNNQSVEKKELYFWVEKGKRYQTNARVNGANIEVNETVYPLLRKCDENGNPIGDDTYEPYKSTTSTFSTPNGFPGIPVNSDGNYTDSNGQQRICDEIVKYADGSGEYVQRVSPFTLDGSETWSKSALAENVFYTMAKFVDGMITNDIFIISDRYISSTNYIGNMPDKVIRYGISGGETPMPIVYIKDSSFSTVEELQTALTENNVKGYYPLATPIRTPLTAEEIAEIEKLHTFYSVTNISNDSDCGMEVTYLADSKIYIDNQIANQMDALREEMANTLALMSAEAQAAMIENDTNNLLAESEE